jgi:HSP20 family protein
MGLEGFEDFKDQVDRLLDHAASRPRGAGHEAYAWQPSADVFRSEDAYTLQIELPGLSREQIGLETAERSLRVFGVRRREKDAAGGEFQLVERRYGPFAREFVLPKDADAAAVRASLKNGLLTVNIPRKSAEPAHRQIRIDVD